MASPARGARAGRAPADAPARRRGRAAGARLGCRRRGVAGRAVRPVVDDALKEITLPLRHEDVIRQQARDKNLDPALIAAVIYRESKFRDVTSEAGAKGMMQILPDTARFIAHQVRRAREFEEARPRQPADQHLLRELVPALPARPVRRQPVAAIAAYNAGHENVDRWGGKGLTLEHIRFPETEQYTRDVLEKRGDYAKEYRTELGL